MPDPGPFEKRFARQKGDPKGLERRPMPEHMDLEHVPARGTVAGSSPAYEDLMSYVTQGAHPAGPDARRAEAGMPAGPRPVDLGADGPPGVHPLGRLVSLIAELTAPRYHIGGK